MAKIIQRNPLAAKLAPQSADLLAWYDRHRRRLPWRAEPGERADPYRVWLSEIMLQQTTVKAVAPYYEAFLGRWPTVEALAAAPLDDVLRAWAGLGYYARARNLHRAAQVVVGDHAGVFPGSARALRTLPGVGEYTAAAIAAIAFDEPAPVVDGNVERVIARLFAVATPLSAAKAEIRRLAATLTPTERPGDFAQATMDLGSTICTPRRPTCALCPWTHACEARALGTPDAFPVRLAKAERPTRHGAAFVALRDDGAVLLRRRAPTGLLGGMVEVPSLWGEAYDEDRARAAAPMTGAWTRLPGTVEHTFTHFHLELAVFVASFDNEAEAAEGSWWAERTALADEALPTLMRRVLTHGLGQTLLLKEYSKPFPTNPSRGSC